MPKKPTKLKYPKKPKASASLATMQKYLKRCQEIDKENRARESEYKKAIALRAKINKR